MENNLARTVTSKDVLRHWKSVTDRALRQPVVITAHGRPRHVLLAYEDYERLRLGTRQAHRTAELPSEIADEILADLSNLRMAKGPATDGDVIIE